MLRRKSEKFLKSEKALAGRRSFSGAPIGPTRGGTLAPLGTSDEPISESPKLPNVGGLARRFKRLNQTLERLIKRSIGRSIGRENAGEAGKNRALDQFDSIAEVAAGEAGVAEIFQRDPTEAEMNPDVVAAGGQGIAKGVSGSLGIASRADLHPFLVIHLRLMDTAGVSEFEAVSPDRDHAERPGSP